MNRTVPLILAVALFMENMDSTVISTSLPAIAADIDTSPIALKLALTAYLVSLAIFIPISSWMADRYGAKRVFRTAICVFVVGSILCAMADSLLGFVVARFAQGMGGAMMTPVARLVLVRSTKKSQLVSAMAWLTIPALVGPLVGPPVGGFITTYFTWHWIFLINVPIGIAGVWLSGRFLPEIEPARTRPLDAVGFLLVAVAASGIVFGLSVISLPALPPPVGIVTTLIGVLAGVLYLSHGCKRPNPILDLRLFRNATFRAAVFGGAMFRIGTGAVPFLLPLMFQLGFGLTPFQSGLLTFASALGALAMKFAAPVTLRVGGFRNALIFTTVSGAAFIAANALFTPSTPAGVIIATLIAAGFLRSLFFTSANTLVFADIEDRETSQATAIAACSQQISIALGVAAAGGILEGYAFFTGLPVGLPAFHFAFVSVAMVTALSVIWFLRLAPEAGNAVSGHRLARQAQDKPGNP
ncbi:MFS transporter [Arvimicrobium flavum]|uniref:MFS transporter n=1 Tax=Arvimicrobium flavum TaxID=3393320 RepID=UPI00237BF5C6|nr:MFS transporter [Mesorhizobium shangrilense]